MRPSRSIASWYALSAASPSLRSARDRARIPSAQSVEATDVAARMRSKARSATSGRPLRVAASSSSIAAQTATKSSGVSSLASSAAASASW